MKKMLYFIPTTVVLFLLALILIGLTGPSDQPEEYITSIAILSVFVISDWLLSRKKWYGCVLGTSLGMYIIYYGSQYHGQVFDERPVGIVICAYYVILAIVTYKSNQQ